jgi:hypothetical protein
MMSNTEKQNHAPFSPAWGKQDEYRKEAMQDIKGELKLFEQGSAVVVTEQELDMRQFKGTVETDDWYVTVVRLRGPQHGLPDGNKKSFLKSSCKIEMDPKVLQRQDASFPEFVTTNEKLINELVRQINAAIKPNEQDPMLSELHWELIDEMKGVLASKAANESTNDLADQEQAISLSEEYVASNLSNGATDVDVAMALYLRGALGGVSALRTALGMPTLGFGHEDDSKVHVNERFNILQAEGNCNPNFVVIDGKRTNSGHAAPGAKILSSEMSRAEAIALADTLQANHDAEVGLSNVRNVTSADLEIRGIRFP